MGLRIASLLRGGIGSMALAALGLAIAGNALWFQGGEHPAPLFASRDANAAPAPATQIAATNAESAPPIVRPRPDPTIMAIQSILAERGYYSGLVDGVSGPGTERAVKSYQTDLGRQALGVADADFLLRLQQDRQPAPLPAPSPKGATQDGIASVIASNDQTAVPSIVQPAPVAAANASEPRLEPQTAAVVPAPVPAAPIIVEPEPDPQIRAVQEALSLSAYGALEPDGLMGPQTADAIRRFQLDQGLTVTGEVDDSLVSRLIRVGAMVSN